MPAFHHGTKITYGAGRGRPVPDDDSDIIFLIGTASAGAINTLVMTTNEVDDAQFLPAGAETPGQTIPQALRAIRKNMANAQVVVVNVRDGTWTDAAAATKIIGGVSASGVRTGFALIDECMSNFGRRPTILIAPGFSPLATVTAEMLVRANQIRAVALIDAPIGTSPAVAIAGRGPAGVINFKTGDPRAILCYPHVKAFDPAAATVVLQPYSQFYAGLMAATAMKDGVERSPSNLELPGIVGIERAISFDVENANCDANMLNAAGIVTVANGYGIGLRAWGNRNASFPATNDYTTFTCCQRTRDRFADALVLYSMPHADKPVTPALRTEVEEAINKKINAKITAGKLAGGRCWVDPAKNTPAALGALGWTVFSIELVCVVPNEVQEFEITLVDDVLVKRT